MILGWTWDDIRPECEFWVFLEFSYIFYDDDIQYLETDILQEVPARGIVSDIKKQCQEQYEEIMRMAEIFALRDILADL